MLKYLLVSQEIFVFHKRTKRQKNFFKILKHTKKRYVCDSDIEKVAGRYEFNVYYPHENELREYLKLYNVEFIKDEEDNFIVVREIK